METSFLRMPCLEHQSLENATRCARFHYVLPTAHQKTFTVRRSTYPRDCLSMELWNVPESEWLYIYISVMVGIWFSSWCKIMKSWLYLYFFWSVWLDSLDLQLYFGECVVCWLYFIMASVCVLLAPVWNLELLGGGSVFLTYWQQRRKVLRDIL